MGVQPKQTGPAVNRRRKAKSARKRSASKQKTYRRAALLAVAGILFLAGLGLATHFARSGNRASDIPVVASTNGVTIDESSNQSPVAEAILSLLSLAPRPTEIEEVPAPSLEPEWEQPNSMPAL